MNTLRTNQDENSSRSIYLTKRPLIAPISSFASVFEDYLTPFLVIVPPFSFVFVSSSKRQHFFFAGPIYFYRENNLIWEEQLVGTKISSQIHSVSVGLLTTPYFCIIFCFYYFLFLFFIYFF